MALALAHDSMVLRDEATLSMVTYHREWLRQNEADALLTSMLGAPWQVEAPVIFGKPRPAKRKTCAFGEPGLTYGYSGMVKEANPWPPFLRDIVEQLSMDAGARFNFALCNLYPDGDAGIAPHADDESDIAPGSPILGLSLGSTRDFILKGRDGDAVASVALEHGSVLAMWLETQSHFKHAVPPRKRVKTPRVSLTFRVMA